MTCDPGKIITLISREAERQGGFACPILPQNPRRNGKEGVQKVTREDEERKTHWAKAYRIWGTVSVVLSTLSICPPNIHRAPTVCLALGISQMKPTEIHPVLGQGPWEPL